jgi:hypothetical protein
MMPADANSYERELARSVDAVGDDTPDDDAMDDADSAYERTGDR